MKKIAYQDIDKVIFVVDVYMIDKSKSFEEQIYSMINDTKHLANDSYIMTSLKDAAALAGKLLIRDDDYNYASITMERFANTEDGNIECVGAEVIGDIWSEDVNEVIYKA